MQNQNDRIEYRGGAATGRFAIVVYAAIRIATLIVIAFISVKAGTAMSNVPWVALLHSL
jgi:hypothetical protein